MVKKIYNLLIITYNYYPVLSPRAFRWTAIAEHWSQQGYHVDVVCRKSPGASKFQIHNGVNIHRISDPMEYIKKAVNTERANLNSTFNNSTFKKNKLIYDLTWKKFYWPDYACMWILPACVKAKRLINSFVYDTIVTVSHPFSAHIVGFLCSKWFKKMKWIVDIGDPFAFVEATPPNNHMLYKKLNFIVEKKILTRATAITVTTNKTKEKYIEHFRDINKKIYIIPPLLSLDFEDTKNCRGKDEKSIQKTKMLFIGMLYKKIRNPHFLLEIFKRLSKRKEMQDIEMHFAGKLHDCVDVFSHYKEILGDKVIYHGLVERKQVYKLIDDAEVLINIDNSTSFQLPSKVVEYMATGKPILNMTMGKIKFTDHLPINYPNICSIDSLQDINESILNEIQHFILGRKILAKNELKKILAPYKLETISEQYLNI